MTEKVYALTFVKDEADIIAYVVYQMFENGIDGMIAAVSHLSQDDTKRILVRLSKKFNITVIQDNNPSFYYFQGKETTKLANAAHTLGADWIVPFDADEAFYSTNGVTVADNLRDNPHDVILVPMWNYCATGKDNPNEPNPILREQWHKPQRNPLNKVCFRWSGSFECANGNHSVIVSGQNQQGVYSNIEIGHFQNRSPEQMIRKIRNERIVRNEQDPNYGYWHKFDSMSDAEITEWWLRDYYFANPERAGLVHNPVPFLRDSK